ncbi:MAG TPA: DUF3644 domain-containing protein [Candidatus Tyrphobacter sp.]
MHDLRASREEALLACDLFNDRRERNLDAFLAHMMRAWHHLLRAITSKEHRLSEMRDWDSHKHLQHYLADPADPLRANLEFFLRLRERIEHRFSRKRLRFVETLVSGKINALLVNFEKTLVAEFGERWSLADAMRFPIFLSSLTRESARLLEGAYEGTPTSVLRFIESYEARLDHSIRVSEAYDFRIYLMPKAPPTERDLPIEFVDLSKLSAEEAEAVENARVIIRDRQIEAINVNRLKAGEVVAQVRMVFPAFSMYRHTLAWRYHGIRPPSNSPDPARTDSKYAVYDRAHRDYLYTEAWVDRLKDELGAAPEAVVARWKPARTEPTEPA